MTLRRSSGWVWGPLAVAATGAVALGYAAAVEPRLFMLREATAPVLEPGQPDIRIVHLSDMHLLPRQHRKRDWVRGLADLRPDLVINTGDNLASPDAVDAVMETYEPLFEFPGAFVWGSNDYYAPVFKNPARYLLPKRGHQLGRRLPWRDLRDQMQGKGWVDLTHHRHHLTVAGRQVELRGVNDPHLGYDRYERVAGQRPRLADLAIGVTHAPYRRVLDGMEADGLELILAGHTHGGQLRIPWFGALVTNCDLPRGQARGLSRWGRSWLHVSAGLGCSPYSHVRFSCPPEATLLTLTAREEVA